MALKHLAGRLEMLRILARIWDGSEWQKILLQEIVAELTRLDVKGSGE
jgi:hypothetical protein